MLEDEIEVLKYIDEDELVDLAVDMGNIYSPAGNEKEIANYIFSWLKENSFIPKRYEIIKNRENIVATIKGKGDGKNLIFNSHMETEIPPKDNKWTMSNPQEAYPKAWIENDKIFGRCVLNDRGPMAAFMIACKAIMNSGIELKGDIIQTMVIGELDMAPIDEYKGLQYEGLGLGTRYLLHHGITGDFAVVAETTGFGITDVQAGAAYFKITVEGNTVYTPKLKRPKNISKHPNAIVKMAEIIKKIENWAVYYENKYKKHFSIGEMKPKVNIGAIRAGIPYRPARTSGLCTIYGDIRVVPGTNIKIIKDEFKRYLDKSGIKAEIEIFNFKQGYEAKNTEVIVKKLKNANFTIRNQEVSSVSTEEISMWRDINVFNENNIPAVVFGPPRHVLAEDYQVKDRFAAKGPGGKLKYFKKEDLVNTAKIFALTALNICT